MQNKAVISGILSIVSGSLGFLGFLVIILAVLFFTFFPSDLTGGSGLEQSMITVMVIVYSISGLITLALSILAIIGGVYSLAFIAYSSYSRTACFFPYRDTGGYIYFNGKAGI